METKPNGKTSKKKELTPEEKKKKARDRKTGSMAGKSIMEASKKRRQALRQKRASAVLQKLEASKQVLRPDNPTKITFGVR